MLQKVVTLQKRFGKTGTVKSENGALYIGNFDENGVKTGLGRYSVQLVQCAVHTVSSPDREDNLRQFMKIFNILQQHETEE